MSDVFELVLSVEDPVLLDDEEDPLDADVLPTLPRLLSAPEEELELPLELRTPESDCAFASASSSRANSFSSAVCCAWSCSCMVEICCSL